MDSISLSRTVFEIFDFEVFRVWLWPLTPKGNLGSKKFIPFERPYMTSYLTSMDIISLSHTVLEIFNFKVSRVWPQPLTPWSHLGSRKFCIIRKAIYDFLFDLYGHHLSISYRFRDIWLQSFQGLTLTFDPLRSSGVKKNLYNSKVHIWLPIWLPWTPSLYLVPYPRYSTSKFLGFDLDLWPSRSSGVKKIIPFERPYMTSYLTYMDIISLSRTVFEIFDFKIFRVRSWPLTP